MLKPTFTKASKEALDHRVTLQDNKNIVVQMVRLFQVRNRQI